MQLTAALVSALVVVASGAVARSAAAAIMGIKTSVIVRALPGEEPTAERAVAKAGGTIGTSLPIIDGFVASVPTGAIMPLETTLGIVSVTPNLRVRPQASTYDPSGDVTSMDSVTEWTGAAGWWSSGYTGDGIDVAVIDSGVSPVEGLADPGKVVYGPDLSLESQASNLTNLDTYGHGTFMAGLIAGHDSSLSGSYEDAAASEYRGMAPDARIVSIKIATADGGVTSLR
jgi:serine protease AprX